MKEAWDFLVFCNPETPRAQAFRAAAIRHGMRATLVPWLRVLRGEVPWETLVTPSTVVRIESPGKNWWVEKEILARGATEVDEEDSYRWRRISHAETAELEDDPGRVWPMRQWFLGWRSLLRSLETNLRGPSVRWMNPPDEVCAMFDKFETQQRLVQAGVPVPESLGLIPTFRELVDRMREARRLRLFLKPCHGSSASGVIALETHDGSIQGWSTLAVHEGKATVKLYNQRQIRHYRNAPEIIPVIKAVCRERAIAQVWHPKPGWNGHRTDLRVLVVGGTAQHVVPRLSRTPVTNLQLGTRRGDAAELRADLGEETWLRAMDVCERAMHAFPKSVYGGVDLLPGPEWTKPAVAEVNAFGDFLPGCKHNGRDTYDAEILAMNKEKRLQVSSAGL